MRMKSIEGQYDPEDGADPDDADDPNDPLQSDMDADESGDASSVEEIDCPACGQAISDLAVYCPHCRTHISQEGLPAGRRSVWKLLVVIILVAVLGGLFLAG